MTGRDTYSAYWKSGVRVKKHSNDQEMGGKPWKQCWSHRTQTLCMKVERKTCFLGAGNVIWNLGRGCVGEFLVSPVAQ
jgi:hypothetical protein